MNSPLLDSFPNFLTTDSIFQKMVPLGAPWTADIAKSMDTCYFTMFSGIKPSTYFVSSTQNVAGIADSQKIASCLWDLFGKNWQRLWDGYTAEYNPIDSYNLKETIERDKTDDRTIGRTGSLSSQLDGTVDQTVNDNGTTTTEFGHIVDSTEAQYRQGESEGTNSLQHGEIVNRQGTVNQFRYGFNSEQQVPTDVQTEQSTDTHTGTDTTTIKDKETVSTNNTVNQTNSGSDKVTVSDKVVTDITTSDTRSDTTKEDTSDNDVINENITRNRTGNLGNKSYQDLLLQEFELWKWNFYFAVFNDCDKLLCLSVYDTCPV